MSRLLRRASWRDLVRRPAHFALAVTGVALGVAVVLGIELSISGARSSFEESARAVSGDVTHQVLGGTRGVPRRLAAVLEERVGRGGEARAVVEGRALIDGGTPLRLLGVDLASARAEADVDLDLLQPDRPAAGGRPPTLTLELELFGHEASLEVAPTLDRGLAPVGLVGDRAERMGIRLGDTVELVTGERVLTGRVVVLVSFAEQLYQEAFDDVLFVESGAAAGMLGLEDAVTRFDLRAPRLEESDREAIEAALPEGTRLVDAGALRDSTQRLTRAFELNLRALALLALVCGAFLVYGTINLSVVERRGQIGLWRSLGTSRATVLGRVLGDVTLLGAFGSVLGVLLGIALAQGLSRLVAQTVTDLYFAIPARSPRFDPALGVRALLMGILVSLLAGLRPALEATRQPPRLSLARSTRAVHVSWRPVIVSLALMASSVVGLWLGGSHLVWTFGALFAGVIGFVVALPSLSGLLAVFLARMTPRRWSVVRLALRSHHLSLERTSVALSALCLAVGTTLGIGVMVGSFRDAVTVWLEGSLRQDIYISSGIGSRRTAWPQHVLDEVAELPQVVRVQTVKRSIVAGSERDPSSTLVVAVDIDREGLADYRLLERSPDPALVEEIWELFSEGPGVLISEPLSYRRGLGAGDSVALETDRGPRELSVLGVYRDYSSDRGEVLMHRRLWQRLFDDHSVDGAALALANDYDVERTRDQVAALLDPRLGLEVRSARGLRKASLDIFDRTFLITGVLRLLAGTIAFLGVLSALLAVLLDRRRDHAVLRSLGMSGRELRRLLLFETTFMGLVAGVFSIPLGLVLGWLLVNVINRRSFGWSMEMQVPPSQLLFAVGLAVLAATAAGLGPARRLLKTPPSVALRSD